jgi:hypothetical protein
MSSPEFSDLRAISGTAVAKRCAMLVSPAKRQLLWFVQGLSVAEGGMRQFVKDLVKMFPKRFRPVDYCALTGNYHFSDSVEPDSEPVPEASDETSIRFALQRRTARQQDSFGSTPHQTLEEFLIDLCINPRLQIRLNGEVQQSATELDAEKAMEKFPELEASAFREAELGYFQDIIGALVEYKRRYEERVLAEFCPTAISRQIWKQLDVALNSKTMVVIDGREGRGKTEAVRAWCNCHLGVARFMSLGGRSTMTAHFREFARALGVGHARAHTISHMQANVEEVLQTSQLMPVIDEAHFTFSQGPRMRTRPEMLDWIDTALCNPPLSVALVTTPQFMICMERAASPAIGWNYRQFKRRCKRYCRLPVNNTPEDIEAVARHLLPGADKRTITLVLGYVALSKRDLSAVGDVVREARLIADQDGARKVTFEHVNRAVREVLVPGDTPWAEMEQRLRHGKGAPLRGRKGMPEAPASDLEASQAQPETHEREVSPRLLPEAPSGNRLRFRETSPALVEAPA